MAQVKKTSHGSVLSSKEGEPVAVQGTSRKNWHVWLMGAFLALSYYAFTQQPKSAPYKQASLFESFFYPYERNAFARLPLITGKINNLHHIEGTDTVWLVGDAGLILVSRDAGVSWQQRTFPTGPEVSHLSNSVKEPWFSLLEVTTATAHASGDAPGDALIVEQRAETYDGAVKQANAGQQGQPFDARQQQQTQPFGSQQRQQIQQTEQGASQQQPSRQPPQQQPRQQDALQRNTGSQLGQLQIDDDSSGDAQTVPTIDVVVDIPEPDIPGLNAIKFLNTSVGMIVGDAGLILLTRDGGDTWQASNAGINTALFDLEFIADRAVVVGAASVILESNSRFNEWYEYEIAEEAYLQGIDHKDGYALVVGSSGTILERDYYGDQTKSGVSKTGEGWQRIYSRGLSGREWLYGVAITGRGSAAIVGSLGYTAFIDQGSLGGVSTYPDLTRFKDLTVLPNGHAIAVGDKGDLFELEPNGDRWQGIDYKNQSERTQVSAQYHAVVSLGGGRILVAGGDGVLLKSDDNGASWYRASIDVAYLFGEPDSTSSTSDESTADQQRSHQQAQLALQDYPYSSFPAPWYWLLCLFAFATAVALSRQKSGGVTVESSSSITDALASDKPLEPNQPDPLKFGAISKGLSRFIRNPSTTPPLTTAITGKWGTGKSSLMNLLYHDLKDYGFTPVWFNAWHHQKGEQLLASLYANIREQAIPKLFHFSAGIPIGLLFRFNLLVNRIKRNRAVSLLLFLIFLGPLLYFVYGIEMSLEEFWASLQQGEDEGFKTLLIAILGSTPLAALLRTLQGFGLDPIKLVSLSAAASSPSAKVDPSARQKFAAQFEQVTQSLELGRMVIFIDDLDRCSKENVVDILEAINFLSVSGNCYIVLGMDEKWVKLCVSDHFEKIAKDDPSFAENYLEKMINIKVPVPPLGAVAVSSLLAPQAELSDEFSARPKVVNWLKDKFGVVWKPAAMAAALAVAFFVFAPEDRTLFGQAGFTNKQQTADKETLAEKETPADKEIIVLGSWDDIRISELSFEGGKPKINLDFSGQSENQDLGQVSDQALDQDSSQIENNVQSTQGESYDLQLVLETTKQQLAAGVSLGQLGDDADSPRVSVRLVEDTTALTELGEGNAGPKQNDTESDHPELGQTDDVTQFYSAQSTRHWLIYVLPALVVLSLLWGLIILAMKRPDRIVTDSAEFNEALTVWQEWILLAHQTPRGLKRFLNNVRYIAMRYRPELEAEKPSVLRSIKQLLLGGEAPQKISNDSDVIDEAGLVALSAIYATNPSWVRDKSKFGSIADGEMFSILTSENDLTLGGQRFDANNSIDLADLDNRLHYAVIKHVKERGGFVSITERDKFLAIVEGK